ncbi:MAG: hypothetical protein ACPGLV_10800 [Bacteroidia bacterium]
MKKVIPYLLLFIATNSFAQIETLKNLVLPDVKLRQLTFSSNFNYRWDSSRMDLEFPISAQYNGYNNLRYKQTFYGAHLNTGVYGNRRSNNIAYNNISSLGFSFDQTRYTPQYYFIRLRTNFNYRANFASVDADNEERLIRERAFRNSSTFSFGKGRLEPLDWALRAAFMNRNLVKSGAIDQNLPEDILLEMARTMAVEDRSRYFENRFFNIRRVKAIDSIMIKNGVDFNELEFYTTINDQYYFAPQRNVFSGSRLEFMANTNTDFENGTTIFDTISYKSKSRNITYNFQLRYEYHLPQNIHIHHRFMSGISYGSGFIDWYTQANGELFRRHEFKGDRANTFFSYSFNWFPSTRTSLSINTNNNFGINGDDRSLNSNANINLVYFVNRRISYSLYGGFNYYRNRSNLTTNAEHSVNFRGYVKYQIF